jgi:hypothetical protein
MMFGWPQLAARRFATGGSPSGCRGRNATRSGCGFFRSSLQAWHRSTLASVCTGLSRGHTTSVRSTKLSWLHRRQRTSSSSQPPAIRIGDPGRRLGRPADELPHAPFMAGEPMRRAIGFLDLGRQIAMSLQGQRHNPACYDCNPILVSSDDVVTRSLEIYGHEPTRHDHYHRNQENGPHGPV